MWRRYVDDVFSVIKKLRIEGLLEHINSVDGNIRFILERECDRGLPFLDVKVNREEGGQLRTAVYRKPTYTNQILNFQSHHSTSAKTSVVRSLMDRLDTHFETEDEEGRNAEKEKIMKTLELNGYPRCFVKQVEIKKKKARADIGEKTITAYNGEEMRCRLSVPYIQGLSESIARVLRPIGIDVAHRANSWKWRLCKAIKDKLPLSKRKGVVYCIECNDCECIYIGETGRTLEDRLKEHQRHTRLGAFEKSAVAEHALLCGHTINWQSARVIDKDAKVVQRRIKESLHIEKLSKKKPLMNKDRGLKIESVWLNSL